MPEERFELLAKNYETEQTELKEKVIRVKSSLTVAEENDSSIAKFISLVRSYTEVNELTPEILNSFIDKDIHRQAWKDKWAESAGSKDCL